MSPQAPKPCPEKVKLLNDCYRATMLLASLADQLAAITDTSTPEFHDALESVRGAREAIEIRRLAVDLHIGEHGCGGYELETSTADGVGVDVPAEPPPDVSLN